MTATPTAQSGPSALSRESLMVVVERNDEGTPTVWCDPEIVDLVTALNKGGIRTIASCSGHGKQNGNIALADGRELIIADNFEEARTMEARLSPPAGARDAVAPDWRNDWLLDLMGEWDTPLPTGMFDAIVERLPKAPQPAATGAGDLPELLADLLEYMNERYDADHDGSSFVANEEMRLGLRIQAALAAQPAPTINSQRIEHMAKNFQIEVFQGEGSYCCIVVVKTMLEATGLAATNLSKGRHLILSRTDEPVTHKTSAAAQAFIDVQLFQLEG